MKFILGICVLSVLNWGATASLFSWVFGQKNAPDSHGNESPDGGGISTSSQGAANLGKPVPFEMKSAESRFLKAGEEYMAGLSVLDTCHHRVIAELESSCNDITEEELGKLGVALLNCQSKSEGRSTFTCTKEMTLAECTRGMDATTWNTYHIISDRSRSVCYGVRQQQFQRQTRFAVNQLAATASNQLNIMENLQEGQDALQNVATDTLQIMADGQKEVLSKQEVLKESQGQLHVSIESNIRDLTSEKTLIAAGHRELATMTESIRQQLDNATQQLLSQDQNLKRNHEDVQRDLASIRIKAKEVWDKLDGDMNHIAIHQEETFQYYSETLENLKRMNDTINYLLNLVNKMQTGIDERLGWLTTLVGGLGNNMNVISTCVTHVAYFLLASLCVTFLHTPAFTRIVLLLLVPINALSKIRHGVGLEFSGLTILITGVAIANWMVIVFKTFWSSKKPSIGAKPPREYGLKKTVCRCNHKGPIFALPPAINRSVISKGFGGYSDDDEDYTLPSDLSAITGDMSSYTYNTDMMSESSGFSQDATMTGTGLTDLDMTFEKSYSMKKSKVNQDTPLISSSTKTPMPLSASAIVFGELRHQGNPAKRHLGSALEELPQATPSPRRRREGTPNSTSSRPSTPGKRLCNGLTKTGQPCRMTCSQGSDYCYRHNNSN
ncbi:protein brambleberry-like [Asterias rubens]|uniref:protein brambleberry-like n=1 Tax=Asterias rubens TaxID=7604 RepID=UPI00145593F4|nr:protein brambleberry-like [Asterias rubens]